MKGERGVWVILIRERGRESNRKREGNCMGSAEREWECVSEVVRRLNSRQ